mmetsp:Transcript_55836/g.92971  ORF Transcript_55836/g.92971 Transcript_55836/m.92971 type:complete len:348 (-) Transcript_55836:109-1152(-)
MELRVGGKYRLGRKIGSGSFGDIYLGTNINTAEEVAIKLESVKTRHPQLAYEYKVYRILAGGVGIPNVRWFGREGDFNVMVMDILGPSLEDLFNFCSRKFTLKTVLMLADQMLARIEYVHTKNFIHRDLKPDNLMYLTKDATSNIMIIDFGLAGDASHGPLSTPCGTAHYVAPEVLSGKAYNGKADMWSLGVIIYMLLCGFPPFFDAQGNQKRLYKLIKLGKYRFPSPYWDYVSEPAKDLIKQLLTLDVEKRLSAQQVMAHKWVNPTPDVQHMDLGKMYMEQMEHFSSSRHFVDAGMKIHGNVPAPPPQFAYFKDTQHAPKYNNKNNDDDGDDGDDDNDDSDTDDDW